MAKSQSIPIQSAVVSVKDIIPRRRTQVNQGNKAGFNPNSETGMGSARVPRASSGVAPELTSNTLPGISRGESLWNEVSGATPKTTRQRRMLPEAHPRGGFPFQNSA